MSHSPSTSAQRFHKQWLQASPRSSSLILIIIALICLPFASLEIFTISPEVELARIATGLITPTLESPQVVIDALLTTLAFAIQGVSLALVFGIILAIFHHYALVSAFCAFIRAIHELFWALLLLQLFGLNSITGILALAIPFAGVFAKVFSEILDEVDPAADQAVPINTSTLSRLLYIRVPLAWGEIKAYTSYRFECAVRSSAVLGFIGLPTIGFHLESFFKQGDYSQASGLLYVLFLLIASLKYWFKLKFIPLLLIASVIYLPWQHSGNWQNFVAFFTHDLVPAPFKHSHIELLPWLNALLTDQAVPGVINTFVLAQLSLVATALLALFWFPFVSKHFLKRKSRILANVFLIIMRSIPEYLLAFVALLVLGPSMLPGIIALALHNGAIVAHLTGNHCSQLTIYLDRATGMNRYFYEVLPRTYRQFMAFLLYRWEVIFRETAILGILGIPTLGFYIDSAFEEIRFDRAIILIVITALLNILIDRFARWLRQRLHSDSSVKMASKR